MPHLVPYDPSFSFFLILFPTLDVFSFLESKKLGSEEDGMNGKKMMKGESGLSGGTTEIEKKGRRVGEGKIK